MSVPFVWRHALVLVLVAASLAASTASAQAVDETSDEAPSPPRLRPPRLLRSEAPIYPSARIDEGAHPTVVLVVVIDAEGHVSRATVDPEHSAGDDFDAAAIAAAERWVFEPARRDGEAIPSRVRLAVHFEPPEFELHLEAPAAAPPAEPGVTPPAEAEPTTEAPSEDPTAAPAEAPEAEVEAEAEEAPEAEEALVYSVHAEVEASRLRAEDRGPSDYRIDRDVLDAAPHLDGGDLLRTAPGVFVSRPEGDAVAHRIMLRGFDAEHGQDLELTLGGIPINQPSHLHGQGYADLNFLIPEVVRSVRVTEGVYDPRQGDFAVAGTADFELGVDRRGMRFETMIGSFRTLRQLAVWAPRGQEADTFGAALFNRTNGFGQNRAGRSGAVMVQYGFGERPWRWRILGTFQAARADLAGVVRADDVASGRLGFYDVYDDPSATAQGAASTRAQLAFFGERRGERGQNDELAIWALFQDFRIQENFTGYTQRSTVNPAWVGRGDLIEQRNRDLAVGLRARHRSAELRPASWLHGHLELGATARLDRIDQSQNLIQQPQNQTWDQRVDATIIALDVGVWADVDFHLTEKLRLRGGVRADLLSYDVNDRLGNRIPSFRSEDHIPGFRRTALGVAAGPRVTVEAMPIDGLTFIAAYGEGYRSPQARLLNDGEPAPFTKVRSSDVGGRLTVGPHDELTLSVSGFYTHLSDDVIFEAEEGRLERIGATRRLGVTAYALAKPLPWLTGALSVTYVNAILLEPPPATVAEPNPAFTKGQALPFVPPWVVRLDLGAEHELGHVGHGLFGRAGLGLQAISGRPLPFDQRAAAFALLDASASLRWAFDDADRSVTVGLVVTNLLGARYAASEYYFASNWDPDSAPTRVPERHRAAGAPRTILLTLGLAL